MSGKSPRQKGDRLERELVKLLEAAGIPAKRVPLSGSARGYPGDITATLPGLGEVCLERFVAECDSLDPVGAAELRAMSQDELRAIAEGQA
jgi:Holliday junction resolvase